MNKITIKQIKKAQKTLKEYIESKSTLQNRIIDNERFFNLQNSTKSKSAWLLNSLMNKHADAMDNYPEAIILPRFKDDVQTAKTLSQIMPIILKQNNFEGIYSKLCWKKLKAGTSVTGVFWNKQKQDIEIKAIDILRLFWQADIEDIQQSKNIFYATLLDNETLHNLYPNIEASTDTFGIFNNNQNKSLLIDWYYKTYNDKGKEIVHLCKFIGDSIVYSSQNMPNLAQIGYYKHGKYPFVFDTLFNQNNSPCGFGFIDIMKESQIYIDTLNELLLTNAKMLGQKRFFVRIDSGINEQEFADWNRPFVHVSGELGNEGIREINLSSMDSSLFNLINSKIDELKETSGNRDFNQGSTSNGITAASAIAALQEAGNKLSRDMLKSSYRSFVDVCMLIVELIRQFYNTPRYMCINQEINPEFINFNNLAMQVDENYRKPEYDITIKPQKSSPFSTLAQNELAKEFYQLGFFEPQNRQSAIMCLNMMNFDGKDELISKLSEEII